MKAGLLALALPSAALAASPSSPPRLAVVAIHDSSPTDAADSAVARDRFAAALARGGGVRILSPAEVEAALGDPEEQARRKTLARAGEAAKRRRALAGKLDDEGALKALEEARDGMQRALASQTDGELAEVLVDLGVTQFKRHQEEAARSSFVQAVAAGAPEGTAGRLPPRAVGLWKEASDSIHHIANAGLDVTSQWPVGVAIYLDGRPVGTTPRLLEGLTEGKHVLRGELAGRRTKVLTVEAENRKNLPVDLTLSPEPPPRVDGSKGTDEAFRGALYTGQALGVDYLAAAGKIDGRAAWMVIDVKKRATVLVGTSEAADPWDGAGLAAGERLAGYLKTGE